jgi:hypothetical protein
MRLRNNVLALAATSVLAACASNRYDIVNQCSDRGAGWQPLPVTPSNSAELLALNSAGRPVQEQLRGGVPLTETWFSRGTDQLMVCRYEEDANVCPVALSVEFTRASNVWSAGPVQSRLCSE